MLWVNLREGDTYGKIQEKYCKDMFGVNLGEDYKKTLRVNTVDMNGAAQV